MLSRCPSPSCRAVHHRQVSIRAVHRRPSPLCSPSIAVARRTRTVPCHRGDVVPSIAVEKPLRCPSLSRSRRTIHCHQGSVTPPLAVKDLSAVLMGPPHIGRSRHRHPPLVTPLPGLLSGWLLRCLSSLRHLPSAGASHCGIASRAYCPVDCRDSSSLQTPPPPIYQHLCLSVRSCHTPLGPLVQLVKALPLLTPAATICGMIKTASRAVLC